MKKHLALLIFCALSAWSQTGGVYTAYKQTALSSAAEILTVQQAAGIVPRTATFTGAYIWCSVACTVTVERNGTAATTTAQTPAPANPQSGPSELQAFNTSNVGVGSVIAGPFNLAASQGMPIDLAKVAFAANSAAAQNITLRTNSITGTVNLGFVWQEY